MEGELFQETDRHVHLGVLSFRLPLSEGSPNHGPVFSELFPSAEFSSVSPDHALTLFHHDFLGRLLLPSLVFFLDKVVLRSRFPARHVVAVVPAAAGNAKAGMAHSDCR